MTLASSVRYPNTFVRLKLLKLVSVVWNVFSLPLFFFVLLPGMVRGVAPDLILSLFVAGGVGVAIYWQWLGQRLAHTGPMSFHLDPLPGSLGGNVGGFLEIMGEEWVGRRFQLTLNCVDVVRGGAGGSGRSSNREIIRWQDQAEVLGGKSEIGARVGICFAIPADLAPSQDQQFDGNDLRRLAFFEGIKWVLRVECLDGPQGLSCSYVVPVAATATPLFTSEATAGMSVAVEKDLSEVADGVAMFHREGYFSFYCPWHRNLGDAAFLLLFGGGLGCAAYGAWNVASVSRGNVLAVVIGGIFTVIALILLIAVLYLLANTLRVDVENGELWVSRSLFGVPWVRKRPVSEVVGFSAEIGRQSGGGADAAVKYTVRARLRSGGRLVVADGVKGAGAARKLVGNLNRACGLRGGDNASQPLTR